MLLMIDNYDSFTYNLVQYFGELKADVVVRRNDMIDVSAIKKLRPGYIVISPGPCTPNEAGVSLDVVKEFAGIVPILGVCLGHQCIAQALGGEIVHADMVMHGKTSTIEHTNKGVFESLPNSIKATRYHSLVVDKNSVPSELEVTAWTSKEDGSMDEIMGLKHKDFRLEGVQFHPESIMTECGHTMLGNFLKG